VVMKSLLSSSELKWPTNLVGPHHISPSGSVKFVGHTLATGELNIDDLFCGGDATKDVHRFYCRDQKVQHNMRLGPYIEN
jgi:hypothetical protein